MRILIIEDEESIASFIRDGLREEGFTVNVMHNGREGRDAILGQAGRYDLLLLDWMLPELSGIQICKSIRKEDKNIPIILLTAKDTVEDVVFGLESGANDYLKKPFAFEELLARIRVLLRAGSDRQSHFTTGSIELDVEAHTIRKEGREIELTQKEFALMEFLLRNKGKVCRRQRIIEKVWDVHFEKDMSVIDVFINSLRKKLDDAGSPSVIQTVRGLGYRINEDP